MFTVVIFTFRVFGSSLNQKKVLFGNKINWGDNPIFGILT